MVLKIDFAWFEMQGLGLFQADNDEKSWRESSQDETKGSAETSCGRLSLALFALSTTFYADYILDLIRRLYQGATITHSKNFTLLCIQH